MATGRTYSGREWLMMIGLANNANGGGQIGNTAQDANLVAGSKVRLRPDAPLNDIAWDAGYQRAEIERAGFRGLRAEDVINHYGSGVWTWDFNYVAENLKGCNLLQHLIYP